MSSTLDAGWQTYANLSGISEYAAALFLLADHLEAAVDVCIRQIKDLQLAVAIARVYEGDDGHVLKKLIREDVLGIAAQEGNRWLASWAFWMLGRKDMAVRALIVRYLLFPVVCQLTWCPIDACVHAYRNTSLARY